MGVKTRMVAGLACGLVLGWWDQGPVQFALADEGVEADLGADLGADLEGDLDTEDMPDLSSLGGDALNMADLMGADGKPDMEALMKQLGGMPGMGGMDAVGGMPGMGGAPELPSGPTRSVSEEDVASTAALSEEEEASVAETSERHDFQAEVARLMDIIINSLYAGKEIFLRELVSNAADSLERFRLAQLDAGADAGALEIRIDWDKDARTVSVLDTGVGMTKSELIDHLGTVAKSGTTNFLEALKSSGDANLIGQFGVGFYSAFLVADKVTVTSCSVDEPGVQNVWQSSADGQFRVSRDPRGPTLKRGTQVTLHLKEDSTEYLNSFRLKDLIVKYSQFITFPIVVRKEGDGAAVWETVNTQRPIWLRARSEVEPKEYDTFYTSLTRDYAPPLHTVHFRGEGEVEFRALLFVPQKAPHDLFENYFQKQASVKLYVRRVLVGDFQGMLPNYLSFVKGVVDSDDLPLNVAREQLQSDHVVQVIGKKLTRKVLDSVKKMSQDYEKRDTLRAEADAASEEDKPAKQEALTKALKYESFLKEFGRSLKLGCYEDDANRARIAKLLRFRSSAGDTSLDAYVAKHPGQKIYYASGESADAILASPQMQVPLKKGLQVLLLTDPMDESCIQRLNEFEGARFVSVQKGDLELEKTQQEKDEFKLLKRVYKPLLTWYKKQLPGVQSVALSERLTTAPCAVTTNAWGYSAYMERMMKVQSAANAEHIKQIQGNKILELNPRHKSVHDLNEMVKRDPEDKAARVLAKSLFDAATLASGYDVEDTAQLTKYLFRQLTEEIQAARTDPSSHDDAEREALLSDAALQAELDEARAAQEAEDEEKRQAQLKKEAERKAKEEAEAKAAEVDEPAPEIPQKITTPDDDKAGHTEL